jgi:hypothetical protein
MDKLLNEISHDQYLFSVANYMQSAWIGHAPFLKFLIREQKPKLFVELGVHNGFSYFVGCQAIEECGLDTQAFAVDHWFGDEQAGFFDDSVFKSVESLNAKYSSFSKLLKMSFDQALNSFAPASIDLLHIDGFHSYESVKEDFDSWLPKMEKNGIILMHDVHVRRNSFGVYKFWEEIKAKYRTIEFVGSHGLGVVILGTAPPGKLTRLLEIADNGNLPQIQGTFGSISDDVLQGSHVGDVNNALEVGDSALAERDSAIAERDSAIAERDSAIAERDSALAERDIVLNSDIWRITKPYRWLRSKI